MYIISHRWLLALGPLGGLIQINIKLAYDGWAQTAKLDGWRLNAALRWNLLELASQRKLGPLCSDSRSRVVAYLGSEAVSDDGVVFLYLAVFCLSVMFCRPAGLVIGLSSDINNHGDRA